LWKILFWKFIFKKEKCSIHKDSQGILIIITIEYAKHIISSYKKLLRHSERWLSISYESFEILLIILPPVLISKKSIVANIIDFIILWNKNLDAFKLVKFVKATLKIVTAKYTWESQIRVENYWEMYWCLKSLFMSELHFLTKNQ